jgi:Sulfatase-modifying factor enzyme 1
MMEKKPADRPSYAELIQRLTGILARLDPGSVPELIASSRDRSRPNLVLPTGPAASLDSASLSDLPTSRAVPMWLIVLTALCLALFVAGLVVYLQRDASVPAPDKTGAAPATPAGMLLVTRPDGSPWLYVDARPVSADAFRSVFADHAGSGDEPVVMISYDQARSYASTRDRRLLRGDEWDAASGLPAFVVADGLAEWVESPEGKREVRRKGKAEVRPDGPQKDVTVRMAKDIVRL